MSRIWQEKYKEKIIDPDDLEKTVEELRHEGNTIATLNGSFDLMHAGHLHILYEASKVADILIVALNSDESIKKYKSADRPIIPLESRLQMMAAIGFVDFITWFHETDPKEILQKIKPDFHVNGEEYGKDCLEAEVVRAHKGQMHLVKRIPGLSTSEIISKIEKIL